MGHLPGRPDRRDPARQRLGLERRPLRRCAGGARRAVLQPPVQRQVARRWSTSHRRSSPSSGCPRRRRWSGRTSFRLEHGHSRREDSRVVKVKIEPACSTGRSAGRGGRLQQRRGVHRRLRREGDPAAQDRGARGPGLRPAPRPGIHRVTDALAQVVVWLNAAANAPGTGPARPGRRRCRAGSRPRSIAAVTGVLLLVVFKYTSNQRAIKRVRDDINANLLALKLFKDSTAVSLRAQGRILLRRVPAVRPRDRADARHGACRCRCSWASSRSGTRPGRSGSARRPSSP